VIRTRGLTHVALEVRDVDRGYEVEVWFEPATPVDPQ
jgi:hypothetical protein